MSGGLTRTKSQHHCPKDLQPLGELADFLVLLAAAVAAEFVAVAVAVADQQARAESDCCFWQSDRTALLVVRSGQLEATARAADLLGRWVGINLGLNGTAERNDVLNERWMRQSGALCALAGGACQRGEKSDGCDGVMQLPRQAPKLQQRKLLAMARRPLQFAVGASP